jgi:uncharacterized membrane protein YcaP (DUF421 family)
MSIDSLFDNWSGVLRVVIVGVLAYVALVVMLRVTGKRTLSKMSAFDLVVTVALGSTLSSIIISQDVALVEGVAAMLLLVGMQFVVTWLAVRSTRVRDLVQADPTLVFFRGDFLRGPMRRERILEREIEAAARESGHASLATVEAVVLETDGAMSVTGWSDADQAISALNELVPAAVRGGDRTPPGAPTKGAG